MEVGFIKADSRNLPRVSVDMVVTFFVQSAEFSSVEMKGTKLLRSTRESYGDYAIGYVQIKRDGELCTVKSRVTPEHKVRKEGYRVTVILNETQSLVQSCQCEDCPTHFKVYLIFDVILQL
ncbi:hypothetical protein evm_012777 [Chilo suppressalis]|nr:hypothetical protein evm_012777 [Chilo suppressalis]